MVYGNSSVVKIAYETFVTVHRDTAVRACDGAGKHRIPVYDDPAIKEESAAVDNVGLQCHLGNGDGGLRHPRGKGLFIVYPKGFTCRAKCCHPGYACCHGKTSFHRETEKQPLQWPSPSVFLTCQPRLSRIWVATLVEMYCPATVVPMALFSSLSSSR